eukprot:COSAG06_NODE_48213_length_333_cov_2.217949_1_plen_61_part_01
MISATCYFEWKRLLSNAFSVNDPWYSVRNHAVSSVLVFARGRPLATWSSGAGRCTHEATME